MKLSARSACLLPSGPQGLPTHFRAHSPRTTVRNWKPTSARGRRPGTGALQPSEGFVWIEKRKTEKRNCSRAECSEGEKVKRKGKSSEVRESCEWHLGNKAPPWCPLLPLHQSLLGLVRSPLLPAPSTRRASLPIGTQDRKCTARNLPIPSL